jgi:hypothetical protein
MVAPTNATTRAMDTTVMMRENMRWLLLEAWFFGVYRHNAQSSAWFSQAKLPGTIVYSVLKMAL